ncbi:hypothetical protein [Musicola paradisiaca]|uniref:Uncharacterized protein n=1 Tax=Musicola paradisiaca (strain Ech703) TaxID=579405 RepID=C6CCP3_MUSP7|nr:hypothetical protein [Musicola paradisiaca]ACS86886.1 hypothetical protein Dd703_3121 [Musicola paradisiaca Ech703]
MRLESNTPDPAQHIVYNYSFYLSFNVNGINVLPRSERVRHTADRVTLLTIRVIKEQVGFFHRGAIYPFAQQFPSGAKMWRSLSHE